VAGVYPGGNPLQRVERLLDLRAFVLEAILVSHPAPP
jgi:hypothetical protein